MGIFLDYKTVVVAKALQNIFGRHRCTIGNSSIGGWLYEGKLHNLPERKKKEQRREANRRFAIKNALVKNHLNYHELFMNNS